MNLFNVIDIETSSYCNRRCATCLRNSWPDKRAIRHLFEQRFMPVGIFWEILEQLLDLDYRGRICLCHWNEPLLDLRIAELARTAKEFDNWYVYLVTNGDRLTERVAKELDGVLDEITVSLYSDATGKEQWIRSLFHKTDVRIKGLHRPAHYNPAAAPMVDMPCRQAPRRCIVAHDGTYLYCCEDLVGQFGFGRFPEVSLKEYWFGDKHVRMWNELRQPGGRRRYPYCAACPWAFGKQSPGSETFTRP